MRQLTNCAGARRCSSRAAASISVEPLSLAVHTPSLSIASIRSPALFVRYSNRPRARSTTIGYLSDFLKEETVTDPTPWVERAVASRIEGAIEEVGLRGLKPIHEQLGGEVDYDAIRIVATCVANRDRA